MENKLATNAKKKLSKRVRNLAKTAQISPKQLAKMRGSKIAQGGPRGGVGKGMAGQ